MQTTTTDLTKTGHIRTDPAKYLTLQFLAWLDESPRSYAEAMDAWRTSCPRLSIWEDAMRDGLIERRIANGAGAEGLRETMVAVTSRGRALLANP
jgi:hypothetical protein